MTARIRKVAVLGGSRFIGHAIVEALLERGYTVATLNRQRSPADYSGPVERVAAERGDPVAYARILAGVEADCLVDVTAYRAADTQAVLEACGDRPVRLIHISSLSAYRWPYPCPVREDWPLETDPAKTYGFDKADCERVLIQSGAGRVPWTILRLPFVFGPRDPVSREAYLRGRIIDGRVIVVPPWPFLCQNLFVQDAARAVLSIIDCPQSAGGIYNVGGEVFSLERYVELLADLLGRQPRMVRATGRVLAEGGADPGKIPYYFERNLALDTRCILNEVGFQPAHSLERNLALTLEWLAATPVSQTRSHWSLPWPDLAPGAGTPAQGHGRPQ